jgi:hypothetical protein
VPASACWLAGATFCIAALALCGRGRQIAVATPAGVGAAAPAAACGSRPGEGVL